jgi:hypothetical protein
MMLIDQGEIAWERKVFHRWPLAPWESL